MTHPNEVDLRRIERSLNGRLRYRYVSPKVHAAQNGYRIESPCCSRNVDPAGGMVDVALVLFETEQECWVLFRKNHDEKRWEADSSHLRLVDLLDRLNKDPERKFWQ